MGEGRGRLCERWGAYSRGETLIREGSNSKSYGMGIRQMSQENSLEMASSEGNVSSTNNHISKCLLKFRRGVAHVTNQEELHYIFCLKFRER